MTNMYKIINFAIFLVIGLVTGNLFAQTVVPVNLTGFNHDIIAEGAGGMNRAAATTSITFDAPFFGNVFYATDFRGNNNQNTPPPFGLPANRIINSITIPGVSYQLARYDMNNAMLLKDIGSSVTLTLETPGVFTAISKLGVSADEEEARTFLFITYNFSDGTQAFTQFTAPDYVIGPGTVSIKGIGAVTRTQTANQAPDSFQGNSEVPILYDNAYTFPAPFNSKLLTSITFRKESVNGSTAIFAINGITAPGAPAAPVATAPTNVTFPSFTANWQAASGATAYFLDVSTSPTFSTLLPNYNNRNVGNVLSFNITGLVNSQTYYYRVRASNASGIGPSSNTITIPFAQCPPGDYTAMTQADIDKFITEYPTCTKISGTLQIQNSTNITNVNGFNNIDTITAGLRVVNNAMLTNLDGFKKLKFVGGIFFITGNSTLISINSFDNLVSLGDFQISSNAILSNVSGFGKTQKIISFNIFDNPELKTFSCFDKISRPLIQFLNNAKLTDIQSIGKIDSITNINIENNAALTNLTALKSVKFIGELNIRTNPSLKNLNDLSALANVNGKIEINKNATLNDISGLKNINPVTIGGSGLVITNNNLLSVCNLPNFCTYLQGAGARNISGNLGNCLTAQAVINACNALTAPVALAAISITNSGFTANWQASSGATKYFLDVSTSSTFTTFVTGFNNLDAGNVLTRSVTGLNANTTYYFRVRANNTSGTSPNSNVIQLTTFGAGLTAPVALAATSITNSGFTANWQVSSGATKYLLDVSTSSTFTTFVGGYNNRDVGNVLSFNVTGLPNAPVYYYRVRASNVSGVSASSNTINVSTNNYTPLALSGFNEDIIAEGAGGMNRAEATTTITFDRPPPVGGFVFYSTDFRGNNNPNSAPPFGLPVNRIINSVDLPGVSYQLAPYDMNNALVLKDGSPRTLTLETPGVFSSISILGASDDRIGATIFNITYNFSDGTKLDAEWNAPHWLSDAPVWVFGTGAVAIKGMGVVTRTQIGTQAPPDFFDGNSESPKLYDNIATFPAPFNSKILNSITFKRESESGSTAIFSVAGFSKCNATNSPVIDISQIGESLCLGSSLIYEASGDAATWQWTGPNNFSTSGNLIELIGGEAVPGRYVLTATNAEGCSTTDTIDVKAVLIGVQGEDGATIELIENNFLVGGMACVGDTLRFIDYGQINIPDSILFAWNFGNGDASTERNPLYQYPDAGSFDVELIIGYRACVLSVKKTVEIVNCRIGSKGNQFAKIYPTPNNGDVNVEVSLPESGDVKVKIYNVQGTLVDTKYFNGVNAIRETMQIKDKGIYYIEILHDFGIERYKTIVLF
jgi:Secretion system C-terminal sorting domain/Receptor L domain